MFEEIISAWPNILLACTALFVAAIAPGATVMAIMGTSMHQGRGAGAVLTAGCMTGSAIWAISAGLGLAAWLANYAGVIWALKIAGGLYLFWLGYKALKSAASTKYLQASAVTERSSRRLFVRGALLHLTNPKAILGWLATVTLSQTGAVSIPVLVVTLILCLLITNIIHFSYALIFASKPAMNAYKKARRWIEGALAGVFGFAGYKLITS